MNPRLTVILVAYRGDRWLPACVESLAAASADRLRLLLVDNYENRCLDDLDLSPFDTRVVRPSTRLGFSEANNFALQFVDLSDGTICFLNQDTKSGEFWLDRSHEVLHGETGFGAVSPGVQTYDWTAWDPNFLDCARHAPEFPAHASPDDSLRPLYEVPVVTAAAMVMRADVLRKVGPFDPIFGSYYEDYDLCRRIRRAGYKIGIVPPARVAHYSGSSTSDRRAEQRRARMIVRNRVIHQLREAGSERWRSLLPYLAYRFPYNLGRSLWGTPSSQSLSVLLGGHRDLIPVLGRMLSERRDREAWMKYLAELGWPPTGENHAPSTQSTASNSEMPA